MKKLLTLLIVALLVFASSNLIAQPSYHGAKMPAGFTNPVRVPHAPLDICNPCSIPNNEADIPDNGDDVTNGGCNYSPPVFTPINLGDNQCGRINGYMVGTDPYRDIDWYQLTLASATDLYVSAYSDFLGELYVFSGDCSNLGSIYYNADYVVAGTPTTLGGTVPAGNYIVAMTCSGYGPGYGGNYMIKISATNPGPPTSWCTAAVPTLSQWGLIILGCVLLGFGTFYIVRMRG